MTIAARTGREPRRRRPGPAPAPSWLDHLSAEHSRAAERAAATETTLTEWGGRVFMIATFFILFVGWTPLQHGAVEQPGGSLLRQASFLGLAAIAVPFILTRWRLALAVLARSWPLLLVFVALAMTTLWSQFPEATVKRFAVLVTIAVAGLGLAVALPRPRAFLIPFAVGLAMVLVLDLSLAALAPGLAYDSLGLAGVHPSKNVAGMVGQAMAITFASLMIAARNPLLFWILAGLTLLSFGFLVLTESKTALGLTVLCVVGLIPVLALAGRSVAVLFLVGGGILLAVGAIVFATAALQLSGADWAVITTGDPTFTNRDDIWAAVLDQIRARPYLGYGFGAVWSMTPDFSPLAAHLGFWTDSPETIVHINQAHNGYLDVVQHGGLFLAAFVALFVVATFVAIVKSLGHPDADRWTVAGNAFFATLFVSFLFSNVLESTIFFPDGLLGQVMIITLLAHAAWQRPAGERAAD